MSESMVTTPVLVRRPRLRPTAKARSSAQTSERSLVRRIEIIWGLLFLNVLTFTPHVSVLPIPSAVGKGITQGALQLALVLALSVNRKLLIRPSILLCIITLLPLEAVVTLITNPHFIGTGYRTFRFIEFVITLWLLSPYWGRRDMLLVRCHLRVMSLVLASVALGLVVAPGRAMAGGRLGGAIWPAPATQVAHYAAVTIGLVVVLWLCGERRGRTTLYSIIPALIILLLTHTRTALLGLVVGLVVASLSMIIVNPRVRKVLSAVAIISVTVGLTASGAIIKYLTRGENSTELTNLTGRTNFWAALETAPRNKFEEIFGFGLSNGMFDGHAVDSNWILSYQDQGIFGIVICALIPAFLLTKSLLESRRLQRSLGLFLTVYCLVASFTEVGFTNASPYMLDVTVAASVLVPPIIGNVSSRPR